MVGENHVDLQAVDAMFAGALEEAVKQEGRLTIVDEIGPIQLLSPAFTSALDHVFSNTADLVATIHYKDERLDHYRNAPNALLLNVTPENRDMLPVALAAMTKQHQAIDRLDQGQEALFFKLARQYIDEARLVQLQKLVNNALPYIEEHKVTPESDGKWSVAGRHGQHHVALRDGQYACDCDLFNGRGSYAGQAGECSHIQAVVMSMLRGGGFAVARN